VSPLVLNLLDHVSLFCNSILMNGSNSIFFSKKKLPLHAYSLPFSGVSLGQSYFLEPLQLPVAGCLSNRL
jgi:hypothetical protein